MIEGNVKNYKLQFWIEIRVSNNKVIEQRFKQKNLHSYQNLSVKSIK